MNRRRRGGFTLIELMLATGLGVVVVLGLAQTDITRVLFYDEIRRLSISSLEASWALSHIMMRLERADRIRIVNSGPPGPPTRVQIRIPTMQVDCPALAPPACPEVCVGCTGGGVVPQPCCFRLPGNYMWDQYSRVGAEVRYYGNIRSAPLAPDCTVDDRFRDIASFTVGFRNEAPPALEVEPLTPNPHDNNTLEVIIVSTATPGQPPYRNRSQVTVRPGLYTYFDNDGNAATPLCPSLNGPCDAGAELAMDTAGNAIANPPAACPP
jgi:hypothetical protein